jgi:GNAT superfamily N-acetyltransferase
MQSKEDIVVRLATNNDLTTCLWFESLDEFGSQTALDKEFMQASLLCGAVFLAEDQGNPVGYAALNFLYASKRPLLSWWFVAVPYRNRGVGSLLRKAVKARLQSLGFRELLISACRPQEIARHRNAGLREVGFLNLGTNETEYFFVEPI